jgi:hypothetical protein
MQTTEAGARLKRFHRAENPRAIVLTPRDITLLGHVARHRFLTSAQLALLDGGSSQNVLRCLRLLFDHGYLDRPKSQLATLHDQGPQPVTYGLGQKGARVLREYGHAINAHLDWTEKNRRAGAVFLAHTLGVAEFMVRLELACRDGRATLIRQEEIIAAAPEETRAAREPLRWEAVSIEQGRRERWTVVPDGVFGLMFPDETSAYFALELDRGTIPIERSGEDHRSIRRKMKTYFDGWRAQRHIEQFGVKQMRVVTVTSSPERVHNMVKAIHDITEKKGSNFFMFIDQATLVSSDPLEAFWTTGKGEQARLID